jgi:hypothetical protein
MKYVVDTHALIWSLEGNPRLGGAGGAGSFANLRSKYYGIKCGDNYLGVIALLLWHLSIRVGEVCFFYDTGTGWRSHSSETADSWCVTALKELAIALTLTIKPF